MKSSSLPALVGAAFIVAAITLISIGPPSSRPPRQQIAIHAPPPGPSSVSGPGLTLTSISVEFPEDTAVYPDGPHADIINANCIACHSASMGLYQPPLSAAAWRKEVEKMRDTYKASIAEEDVPAIVAYLAAMSAEAAVDASTAAPEPAK
jgi:hypothetical protein